MSDAWVPPLRVREDGNRCRLWLGSWVCGEGDSLQDAADDLVDRLAQMARAMRSSGMRATTESGAPERRVLELLWQIGDRVSCNEDVRELVFGSPDHT